MISNHGEKRRNAKEKQTEINDRQVESILTPPKLRK